MKTDWGAVAIDQHVTCTVVNHAVMKAPRGLAIRVLFAELSLEKNVNSILANRAPRRIQTGSEGSVTAQHEPGRPRLWKPYGLGEETVQNCLPSEDR